jgi:two-component system cell cycle sensor histidine kinase/response regulator CckA
MTSLRLLLVEDNDDDAELVLRELERAGLRTAVTRVQAEIPLRAALDMGGWDMVIADHAMPGFSGLTALAMVRRADPDLPFLLVSGSIGEDLAVAAMRAGAQDYLMKNHLARLGPAVNRELREAASRRARRRDADALVASETALRTILEAINEGVVALDGAGLVRRINLVASRLVGRTAMEAEGRTLAQLCRWTDLDGQALDNPLPLIIERRGRKDELHLLADPGGTAVHRVAVSANVLRDGDSAAGTVVVLRDVTDAVRREEELRQNQKLSALGQLAGGIAHDFNNMLTGILGYSDLLMTRLPALDPSRRCAEQIAASAERAAELTAQLLSFARKGKLVTRPFDVHAAARDAVALAERTFDRRIHLVAELRARRSVVLGYRTQVQNALLNLLFNARDALPGGGTVRVTTRDLTLDASAVAALGQPVAAGDYIELAVIDGGMGMTPEVLARCFEPFFSTKGLGKGTGLGLASVYGTMHDHHGAMAVESTPGQGTTFRLFLPLASASAPPTPTARTSVRKPSSGARVLVVDDDPVLRSYLTEALGQARYAVVTAKDEDEALAAAAQRPAPDLVLLDLLMPDCEVRGLYARLRAALPNVPVVAMSGYAPDDQLDALMREGVVGFLPKPFTPADLERVVNQALTTTAET